ncbi:hypothetical protein M6B38_226640 [Iris pallida]|uniref:Uncharacterized protein n=1 Tax=Iris pallida TaxID=29817 RepID=A0AAX6DUL8_IRIPA|nr:hypothetical protein M6B38_226640 [Iris pallida]
MPRNQPPPPGREVGLSATKSAPVAARHPSAGGVSGTAVETVDGGACL